MPPGRPAIGPRAQIHVPPKIWRVVERMKDEEGTEQSDAFRELLALGVKAKKQKAGRK